jgi:hypothetical protein
MIIYISVGPECGGEAAQNPDDEQLRLDPYDLETAVKSIIHSSSTGEDGTSGILAKACQSSK